MVKFDLLNNLIGEGSDLSDQYMMEDTGSPIYTDELNEYENIYKDVEYEIDEEEHGDSMPEGFVEIPEEDDPLMKDIERRATELSNQWIMEEYLNRDKK